MDELQRILTTKINELKHLIEISEQCLATSPEGSLQISRNQNTIQFYHRTNPKDTHGIYIKKSETRLLTQLARKEYAKKLCVLAKKEYNNLIICLNKYHPESLLEVFENLAEPKKKLVIPYILSEKEYIQAWKGKKQKMKEQYGKKDLLLLSEEEALLTEQGERVRSKSEKILADKLYMMGIPYVYECPLYMKGYGYVHPDFMLLNCRSRNEYVYEHFGLMNNMEYCEKAIKKIESYERNGIYPGRSLLITYETEGHPVNMKVFEGMMREYLL